MSQSQVTYAIEGDVRPAELAPHVVSRLATRMRHGAKRYRGVHAAKGVAVVSAVQEGHTVSVMFGTGEHYRVPLIRVKVEGQEAAKWAAISFPVFSLAGLVGVARLRGGAALGLMAGLVLGVLGAYSVFTLAGRWSRERGGSSFASERIQKRYGELAKQVIGELGLTLAEVDAPLAGLDTPHGKATATESPEEALALGDEAAWTKVMQTAIRAVPEVG